MDRNSLITARELIFKVINNSNIPKVDKAELLLNLYNLLDPNNYEKDINTLKKYKKKGK